MAYKCDTCFKQPICKYSDNFKKNIDTLKTDFNAINIKIKYSLECGYYLKK